MLKMLKIEIFKVFGWLTPTESQMQPNFLVTIIVYTIALVALFLVLKAVHDIINKQDVGETMMLFVLDSVLLFAFAFLLYLVFLFFYWV